MSFLDFFRQKNSANAAKNRLSIMLAHERSVNIPYMEEMQREILEVVKKYTKSSQVQIKTNSNQNISTLEVEVTLGS
ncbi:cell division topological specificity factor MinE [Helicobacter mustelae]|uniref:Cell division topological specificity factor n=1 Tax=Helicobacter mustelae (strain ATCC 43772 / CCUG 25715 / CIP 103759 / LMG 18044 / NCTC 12198 / R85-136P) TaxID=679897 RepID=D3UIQ7_HELM1|nr:cell division topological specificity factor MinE [Helicobacter mustelae]CBG40382.1 cell division topological specificity factor [Helicobacter mustelae 12198]SQH71881.1 cell division topological specificity factor [Helicobacter mustelae]STP13021.1 cell division topological specificity factor [Helicobacter mustelae]